MWQNMGTASVGRNLITRFSDPSDTYNTVLHNVQYLLIKLKFCGTVASYIISWDNKMAVWTIAIQMDIIRGLEICSQLCLLREMTFLNLQ